MFAAATPWGDWSPAVDARLDILDNQLRELPLDPDSPTGFASSDRRVAILIEPPGRSWFASITQGSVPFSVSALALHPTAAVSASLSAPPPRVRCRICKTTAKALALAIVAAAGAVFLPQALVAAVATFLGGVGTVAAMAFIQAVIGDTADVVAEKLCLAVGLCP